MAVLSLKDQEFVEAVKQWAPEKRKEIEKQYKQMAIAYGVTHGGLPVTETNKREVARCLAIAEEVQKAPSPDIFKTNPKWEDGYQKQS